MNAKAQTKSRPSTPPKKPGNVQKRPGGVPDKSSSTFFLIAVVGIVLIGAVAVLVIAKTRPSAISGDPTAPVTITGNPVSAMPDSTSLTDASSEPSYGKVAPTLAGTNFSGDDVTIAPDGKYKAVYFIAHWCPHCQKEVPLVAQLISEGKVPANMEIYAVSTSVRADAGNYPPQVWLDRVKLGATGIIRDDPNSDALVAYGSGGFPYVVYLDGQNRVIARSSGELGKDGIQAMWEKVSAVTLPQ
jgi:thiol-disulfide isomerase/thioredoxin